MVRTITIVAKVDTISQRTALVMAILSPLLMVRMYTHTHNGDGAHHVSYIILYIVIVLHCVSCSYTVISF